MSKPKRPRDPNQLAKFIVDIAIGERSLPRSEEQTARKLAGHKGGLKGGKTRMAALSTEERKQLAQKAANARWPKKEALAKLANAPKKRSVKSER